MPYVNPYQQHETLWARLSVLVTARNELLNQLGYTASHAGAYSPASAMFIEFDTDQARLILAQAEALLPEIYALIVVLNLVSKPLATPKVTRITPKNLK